jgi:arylsulfatase A-like enzyme
MATAPWTLPSHGSLLSGVSAAATGGDWLTPIRDDLPSLAAAFEARGYASGGFVANLLYTSYESGLARGFARYDDYRVSLDTILRHSPLTRIDIRSRLPEAKSWPEVRDAALGTHLAPGGLVPADTFRSADQIASAFLDWQAGLGSRPFFAFLNLFDAHGPYRAPEAYLNQFQTDGASHAIDRYDAAIRWMDHVIGTTLDELRRRRVLDRTLVVITSDHGEQFGEHGLNDHANSLYLPLLHVPLLVRYPPSVPPGARVGATVTLRDVPATVLDLAGVTGTTLPGQSLARYWTSSPPEPGETIAELAKGVNVPPDHRNFAGAMISRFDDRFHYIRNADRSEELYLYRSDVSESTDLAGRPEYQMDVMRLGRDLPLTP